ncbi:FkbM family methyltransferase [Microbulbifer sp. CAU 1566]|uniref:FkbM family methyltransferase n=1 Tax=Microbulbifer sp. CAU 1566 TaxID=2933269 RepID=UPI002005B487|nr:FkbM family methyltransferase [Microbulbifer sp. CAU 1566]MCK7597360.1 FkbM family methyltransferase [Microbulbifer sp. CAU 1566]
MQDENDWSKSQTTLYEDNFDQVANEGGSDVKSARLNSNNADILSLAVEKWMAADWDALISIDTASISGLESGWKLALLKASAYQQCGNHLSCQEFLSIAEELGCRAAVARTVLFSGIDNSLGKMFSLLDDDEKAMRYFDSALEPITTSVDRLTSVRSRAVSELSRLGLLPKASKLLTQELERDICGVMPFQQIDARLKILESEVELINHQLTLCYRKAQLFASSSKSLDHEDLADRDKYLSSLKQLSPSQLGQDIWVLEKTNFKKGGFFVEFGATNGVLLSNTYLLEKKFEWTGICAEPNPKFFKELQQNRSCLVRNTCISDRTGDEVEFIFAEEYGGITKFATGDNHTEKREAYSSAGLKVMLKTVSLHDFLLSVDAPIDIDYISIDTEGSEYAILRNFLFSKWRVKIFSVEHNYSENRNNIYELLSREGYQRVECQWDDLYYKPKYFKFD